MKKIRKKPEVFRHGQIRIQRKPLRHVTDDGFQEFPFLKNVFAADEAFPAVRMEKAAEDTEQSGFPRTVGPDQAQPFALPDIEIQPVQGLYRPECPAEIPDLHVKGQGF
jgi:hypothetical protein